MTVVWPNYHIMLDKGAAWIEPPTLQLFHVVRGVFPNTAFLSLQPWHSLKQKYLLHHRWEVCQVRP